MAEDLVALGLAEGKGRAGYRLLHPPRSFGGTLEWHLARELAMRLGFDTATALRSGAPGVGGDLDVVAAPGPGTPERGERYTAPRHAMLPRSLLPSRRLSCRLSCRLSLATILAAIPAAAGAAPPPTPPAAAARERLAAELDAYLHEHVLGPRFPRCVDRERGGFHATYGRDWTPLEDRSRFVVYEARATWTAAAVARLRPEWRVEYLPYVRHGVRFLAEVLGDREHGGFHTFVDLAGRPVHGGGVPSRPVYGQAFAVYGLAAAHAATGDALPLDLARRGFRFVEDHYRDWLGPGYRSAVRPDGTQFPVPADEGLAERQSIDGPGHHRTMNDHIHLLEAYAELLRSWPDPELRRRTEELLAFVRDRLFAEPGCLHLALRPDGGVVPAPVSFGHDVETAFLMIEAEDALGRAPSPATLRAARRLVDHALDRGFDHRRGQLFEYGSAYGPPVDRSVQWWAQFEAWNAFFLMHELYGRETSRYWDAATKAWALTRDAFTDREHPGVCPQMDEKGEVHCDTKSHPWFASYHTARALLLTADRLRSERPERWRPGRP